MDNLVNTRRNTDLFLFLQSDCRHAQRQQHKKIQMYASPENMSRKVTLPAQRWHPRIDSKYIMVSDRARAHSTHTFILGNVKVTVRNIYLKLKANNPRIQ